MGIPITVLLLTYAAGVIMGRWWRGGSKQPRDAKGRFIKERV